MKCPRCQEEVALARVCPYCGQHIPPDVPDAARRPKPGQEERGSQPSGRFRGPIDGSGTQGASPPGGSLSDWLLLPRYLLDASVPARRKLLLLLGIVYVIVPFDITPDFIPLLGWLDDIGVGVFLWHYFRNELARYRRRRTP